MLIVISLKNIEKTVFITKCSYVDFKMGSKVIKCYNQSIFYKLCFFFFFSGPTTRCFLNSKKGRNLSECLNINMFIIKRTHLEASYKGFYKDKHCKFCAIMTEILPHLDLTEIFGLL